MSTERRISITGFMAAGKTTVAGTLAHKLGARMIDLDYLIAERERRSTAVLIEQEGEARFREAEARALHVVLEMGRARVIALGGGAWMQPENRALLNAHDCFTVWLDAPFELCWRRITEDTEARPLARDAESARRLYDERRALYALAELHLQCDEQKTPDELAEEILQALGRDRHDERS